MFTGIIECLGTITKIEKDKGNFHFTIQSPLSETFKPDQSVSHNGVCLTVTNVIANTHQVTAIEETLLKTNLRNLQIGAPINIERCTVVGGRLDGHIVQGHVDQTGVCTERIETNGSWLYTFRYKPSLENLVVEKGSICINGISLTAFKAVDDMFTVAIIPYTYEHTNIHTIQVNDTVNLEFDIIGKYVARMMTFKQERLRG